MTNLGFDKKFFKKKRKQKYPRNTFFSYKGKNRSRKNFNFKDFRNSDSIHSKFNYCSFYGTYFNKSNLKYSSFNGAKFNSVDFKSCNFNGSRFLGATFENCMFENCRFKKAYFKDAKFINCFVKGNKFNGARNLPPDFKPGKVPKLENEGIKDRLLDKYAHTSIGGLLSNKNVSRLLQVFTEDEIVLGLDHLKQKDIKKISFSHMTVFIERLTESANTPKIMSDDSNIY